MVRWREDLKETPENDPNIGVNDDFFSGFAKKGSD